MINHKILKIFGIIFIFVSLLFFFNLIRNNLTNKKIPTKHIETVYVTDNNYVLFMRTSIRSMIANKNPETKITIYVIGYNLSDKDIKKIKKEQRKNVDIKIIPIEKELLKPLSGGTKINPNVTKVDNAKFFLTTLLKHTDKGIYLDGDTIVLKDLAELYNTNLSDNYIAAADDWQTGWPDDPQKRYFNNGVMLLNLKEMRKNDIEKKLVDFKLNDKIKRFVTQDAFNNVMFGKVIYLPLIYDTFAPEYDNDIFIIRKIQKTLKGNFKPELYPYKTAADFRKDVVIIHYCGYGNKKPWYRLSTGRKSNLIWYRYAPIDFWGYCLQGNCKTPEELAIRALKRKK